MMELDLGVLSGSWLLCVSFTTVNPVSSGCLRQQTPGYNKRPIISR